MAALGITWILDGLEVTLAGSLAGALKDSPVLRFSNTDIGLASSVYLAGAVIGGEYASINSTIQELIPARVRGWSDLVINGSFWVGAAMGALGSRASVFGGYLLGAVLMVAGGLVAWRWGVAAERKSLEAVARPLTFID